MRNLRIDAVNYCSWVSSLCSDYHCLFCVNKKGETCPIRIASKEYGYSCFDYCKLFPEDAAAIISYYSQKKASRM